MSDKTYKFGLIGCPLSHSLSKFIHTAAFNSTGLSGTYDILETKGEELVDRIKFLKSSGYNGFNVTIPHKIPICLFLSQADKIADRLGSVNTVLITQDKKLIGYNTDVYGFMKQLEDINLKGKKAVILGTGGASRAVICGLFMLGVNKIDIYSRNIKNSAPAIEAVKSKFPEIEFKSFEYSSMKDLSDSAVVVNTTPLGMKNFRQGVSPLSNEMIETLDDTAVIYDIVYNPIKTELIKRAIKYNKPYRTGLDMLVYQGAKAFEIWTGTAPNPDKMKIAALEELI